MISFNLLTTPPEVFNSTLLRSLVNTTILSEGKETGEVVYVFCDDPYLYEMNKQFLQHDALTDIITFPSSEAERIISGEIYISLDRVRENAKEMHQSFQHELHRVAVHGVLHLLGYDDQTIKQKDIMRAKEDYYINLLPRTKH